TTTNPITPVNFGDSKSTVVKDVVTSTVKLDSQIATVGSSEPITATATFTEVYTDKPQNTDTSEPLVEEVKQEEITNTEKSKGGQVVKWGIATLAILAIVKLFKK